MLLSINYYFSKRVLLKDYFLVDCYEDPESLLPTFLSKCKSKPKETENNDALEGAEDFELQPMRVRASGFDEDNQIQIVDFNEEDEHEEDDKDKETSSETSLKKNKFKVYWKRYDSFTQSPKVHFFYDTIFYTVFLIIFSYMLLCEYSYHLNDEDVNLMDRNLTHFEEFYTNMTTNLTNTFNNGKTVRLPSFIEYLLAFWVFSFLIDEIYQVKIEDVFFGFTMMTKN